MNLPTFQARALRRYAAPAVVAFMITSCGGSTPNSPTAALMAPTVSSPEDDSLATGRPSLTVNNPPASSGGGRTYDFQVADSPAALTGPPDGLFVSATGVVEGAGGRTTYQMTRDVQAGRRYFWRARAVQAGTAGPWSSAFRFRTDSAGNGPPVIQTITVSPRAEARTELDVTAVVQDQETGPANLIYEWTAPSGSFSGSGASVRWLAPAITSPTVYDLSLTVIERYTVPIAGGGEEARENRASRSATVHVNDSTREITTLATTFIDDFVHSDRTPEFCVRSFSNNCPGKADELRDIQDNRRLFVNDPALSSSGTGSIGYYDIGDVVRRKAVPTPQAGFAEFLAPCRFARVTKATGVFGVVTGTCRLTGVYENWQWRLCDSNFLP
jgi:hypothetical protein